MPRRTCWCSAVTSKRSPTVSSIPGCRRCSARRAGARDHEPDRGRPRGHACFAVAWPRAALREPASAAAACAAVRNRPALHAAGGTLAEVPVIAGLAAGAALPEQWGAPSGRRFLRREGGPRGADSRDRSVRRFSLRAGQHPALHPGQSSRIVRDGACGRLARTPAPGARAQARLDIFRRGLRDRDRVRTARAGCRSTARYRGFRPCDATSRWSSTSRLRAGAAGQHRGRVRAPV